MKLQELQDDGIVSYELLRDIQRLALSFAITVGENNCIYI